MTRQEALVETALHTQLGNYRPAPLVFTRGQGCRLEDVDGNRYLDLSAGIAVVSVGHAHPRLASAIGEQAQRLLHVSNLFYNDRAIELADALTRRTPFDRVFFCNSGTEANEAMLKLVRRYHHGRGNPERVELVSAINSFHGRTLGALSVTGQTKHQEGMEPLLPSVHHVPFGDVEALRQAVGPRTAGVVLEPIQAEGGIVVPDDDYLRQARALCDEVGALLLLDEVQTGYGRTGRFLAREHSGVTPDACALAKGIGGGFPLGAMLVSEAVSSGLPPGSHAATFGGNPLACAAGLAVLQIFDEEGLVEHADRVGMHLRDALQRIAAKRSGILEVRGRGLLQGLQLETGVDLASVLRVLRERGVLVSAAAGNVLRITPPLCVTQAEIDEGLAAVDAVLSDPPRASSG